MCGRGVWANVRERAQRTAAELLQVVEEEKLAINRHVLKAIIDAGAQGPDAGLVRRWLFQLLEYFCATRLKNFHSTILLEILSVPKVGKAWGENEEDTVEWMCGEITEYAGQSGSAARCQDSTETIRNFPCDAGARSPDEGGMPTLKYAVQLLRDAARGQPGQPGQPGNLGKPMAISSWAPRPTIAGANGQDGGTYYEAAQRSTTLVATVAVLGQEGSEEDFYRIIDTLPLLPRGDDGTNDFNDAFEPDQRKAAKEVLDATLQNERLLGRRVVLLDENRVLDTGGRLYEPPGASYEKVSKNGMSIFRPRSTTSNLPLVIRHPPLGICADGRPFVSLESQHERCVVARILQQALRRAGVTGDEERPDPVAASYLARGLCSGAHLGRFVANLHWREFMLPGSHKAALQETGDPHRDADGPRRIEAFGVLFKVCQVADALRNDIGEMRNAITELAGERIGEVNAMMGSPTDESNYQVQQLAYYYRRRVSSLLGIEGLVQKRETEAPETVPKDREEIAEWRNFRCLAVKGALDRADAEIRWLGEAHEGRQREIRQDSLPYETSLSDWEKADRYLWLQVPYEGDLEEAFCEDYLRRCGEAGRPCVELFSPHFPRETPVGTFQAARGDKKQVTVFFPNPRADEKNRTHPEVLLTKLFHRIRKQLQDRGDREDREGTLFSAPYWDRNFLEGRRAEVMAELAKAFGGDEESAARALRLHTLPVTGSQTLSGVYRKAMKAAGLKRMCQANVGRTGKTGQYRFYIDDKSPGSRPGWLLQGQSKRPLPQVAGRGRNQQPAKKQKGGGRSAAAAGRSDTPDIRAFFAPTSAKPAAGAGKG